ncbi:MAG: pentapeptide repeat-containing protein [Dehalobacter sp.]|nr:pentapeptide repeat-containing protein [Dehalobacter sp.]
MFFVLEDQILSGIREPIDIFAEQRRSLRADCENCFGLCCTALYFSASEGFPNDKEAGQPCRNLQEDFRCCIYQDLQGLGLKGCMAFDCFGAGPKVSRLSYGGRDWRRSPEFQEQMFEVFLVIRQLQEMLWYLTEAETLQPAHSVHEALCTLREETERLTLLSPCELLKMDVPLYRTEVNTLLLQTSELVRVSICQERNIQAGILKTFKRRSSLVAADLRETDLRGANLRGACLIAADLSGNDLGGADLIGADLRDADLSGTDLSQSIFLTQAQLNTAKGDKHTKLPPSLFYPRQWSLD